MAGNLLSVDQAAMQVCTSPRFVRRLIAERRIALHRVGRYVRIAESDLIALIDRGRVEPITPRRLRRGGGLMGGNTAAKEE